jgi:hypothetical protein
MASMKSIVTRERVALAGDALLMTAAAFSAVIGLTAVLVAPTGTPEPGMEWATALSSVLAMAVGVVVPILVWLMHRRRLTGMAVLGGVLGGLSTGIVFMGMVALSALFGLLASPFTDWEFAGPVAMLVVASAAFVAVGLWLVVEAIRDLGPARRAHLLIDVLRLVSAVVLTVVTVGVAVWIGSHPGDESAEAPVYAMVVGLGGAFAVLGAELLTGLSKPKAPPASPALTGGGGGPGAAG